MAYSPQPIRTFSFEWVRGLHFVHLLEKLVACHNQLLPLLRILLVRLPLRRQILSLRQL